VPDLEKLSLSLGWGGHDTEMDVEAIHYTGAKEETCERSGVESSWRRGL
jgi:hypothetical protein